MIGAPLLFFRKQIEINHRMAEGGALREFRPKRNRETHGVRESLSVEKLSGGSPQLRSLY